MIERRSQFDLEIGMKSFGNGFQRKPLLDAAPDVCARGT
jgi:hypothetical protein